MSDRIEQSHEGKHAVQQASLVGHMERAGLLERGNVFVEFGAGKGELSRYVFGAVGEGCGFVLIDRRNFRQKVRAELWELANEGKASEVRATRSLQSFREPIASNPVFHHTSAH